ncbi:hypothetical protein DFH08DRAFT_985314 [Mycena albidolilacea]|uniref:Uncharacterized protein n=1 Tax=Mycena albidolilacea TaxID=1033008 RepID=A0AAD7EXL2_9AGAR|nr:hypothetical protein DFH08DRAFT_985314 [Mycena albidolilacea]
MKGSNAAILFHASSVLVPQLRLFRGIAILLRSPVSAARPWRVTTLCIFRPMAQPDATHLAGSCLPSSDRYQRSGNATETSSSHVPAIRRAKYQRVGFRPFLGAIWKHPDNSIYRIHLGTVTDRDDVARAYVLGSEHERASEWFLFADGGFSDLRFFGFRPQGSGGNESVRQEVGPSAVRRRSEAARGTIAGFADGKACRRATRPQNSGLDRTDSYPQGIDEAKPIRGLRNGHDRRRGASYTSSKVRDWRVDDAR